ncbi:MAG: 1,6-dihydroxycyclohexa-2,4-diene-1-carboxylate dehydrogenase [Cycloclasticus sp.]|nr:1,6-dihydroxycyclohexa-2,4-diene-1-carboxylate dehydrogenase [Cycloclasticus sp.]MBG95884.1 1,6-dihydroxycyclohexa-2,4-diene-1-carboxylate dehydrogenase [Cycloclasticus sp.]HAI97124.1 1,6-dihydroxycyclohexa-2,4-diene-1-carboxylate dehydrogenase [Methylococcaceae bacterium]|tara:strand:+ start:947 stop:1729 length:783 start_codon:yes stop_codon:yes gene_type:complete
MSQRFENKVVVVTGAAQGIGKACAVRFAAEGASVVIADRAEEQARKVQQEIIAQGGEASVCAVDLETSAGAKEVMQATVDIYGRIDVSVHNVGGTIWAKPFWQYPEDQIEKEINRSLWPTLWCCRAVLPFMIEQQSGAIVNVGSVATRGVNRVPYSAAKGGVQAITTCMALELAEHNIRVNCVNPGGVDQGERATPRHTGEMTDIDKAGMQGVVEQTMRDTPMKRYGTPEEEAAAICFLAADESSYITGETINVAGGGIG